MLMKGSFTVAELDAPTLEAGRLSLLPLKCMFSRRFLGSQAPADSLTGASPLVLPSEKQATGKAPSFT